MREKIRNYFHNLKYLHGNQEIPLPVYIFLYVSFVVGLIFVVLTATNINHGLTMYEVMLSSSGEAGTMLWGLMLIGVGIGSVHAIGIRNKFLAEVLAFVGFGLWFYLAWVYGLNGYFDGIPITIIPNLVFWVWYSMKIEFYKKVL